MPKAYVNLYQRQIVINSKVIEQEEYIKLKKLLQQYKKIDENTLRTDKSIDDSTKDTIRNSFGIIYEIARSEWRAVEYNEIGNIQCSLCNQPNEIIFFIENTLNGNKLNVGSTCIHHFKGLENSISSESIEELIKRVTRSSERVQRSNNFNNAYPNLDEQLFEFERVLEKSIVLLPTPLYSRLGNNIRDIRKFRNEYLECKINQGCLADLADVIRECSNLINVEITDWFAENKDNDFICDLETAQWLSKRKRNDIVEKIRANNSRINENTIIEVFSPSFIKKHINTFYNRLSNIFTSIQCEESYMLVQFQDKTIGSLKFCCSHKDFVVRFGAALFNESFSVDMKNCLLNIFEPQNSISNHYDFVLILDKIFRTYEFLYDSESHSIYIISQKRYAFAQSYGTANVSKNLLSKTLGIPILPVGIVENTYFNRLLWCSMEQFDNNHLKELRKIKRDVY